MAGGVGDGDIMSALAELLQNRELGDDPVRHICLAASGYLMLNAPYPDVPD